VQDANVQGVLRFAAWVIPLGLTVIVIYRLRRKPKVVFYSIVASTFGWGCTLIQAVPPFFNPELAHSLGHALVIAAILSLTVDQYVKWRVLREVTSDISKYLIGYRLPEQLQDRIRSIMQTKWILRNFQVRIRITPRPGTKLEADVTIRESVQNITSETQDYGDFISFSKLEKNKVTELRCDGGSREANYHFGEAEIQRVEDSGQIRYAAQRVRIPPIADADREFQFSKRYLVSHTYASREVLTFREPTIGADIQITDCPNDLKFYLVPPADQEAHRRWTYNRLFLPGEQIIIQWEREEEAEA
jgi:hypothetical protein